MATKNLEIASVLSYEKKLVLSDGYMYGTTWENRFDESEIKPLSVVTKSVRGTISNRLKPAVQNDPAKLNAEVEKANLQRVDACALDMKQDTLKLSYTLKVLSGVETPSACNHEEFGRKYKHAAEAYIQKNGFTELARRYAINIANARFLWRNRMGAEQIEVHVTADGMEWIFNGYDYSLKNFEGNSRIDELAEKIAAALSGKRPHVFIRVDAYALLGIGQEVYPSEELVLDKGRGEKSKVLYQVQGSAAMHSQKLGNAIRTIDTWYPAFGTEAGVGPIAVEPYGVVTNLGQAFRVAKEKADFYSLFDKFALGKQLDDVEQEHYVMAVLVRGGVFGQSSRE